MIAVLDAAPWDDEPSTPDEEAAVAEARAAISRGEGIGWDQVKAELVATEPDGWEVVLAPAAVRAQAAQQD